MGRWGKFDFGAFENFAKTFQRVVDDNVIEKFIEEFLIEMAMRALRKIKKRTPVGETGDLRKGWQVATVIKQGNSYVIEIYNPILYAKYVEYGHRTGKNLTSWVEGRFMMTISMKEIERELPRYLEKRITALLNDIMRGKIPKKR